MTLGKSLTLRALLNLILNPGAGLDGLSYILLWLNFSDEFWGKAGK